MWSKNFRICLFNAVYQELFTKGLTDSNLSFDWTLVFDTIENQAELPDIQNLDRSLEFLKENQTKYESILQKYLSNWNKTYSIVRAIMLCFLQEVSEAQAISKTDLEVVEIISKYIKLTEEYVGGENTALVHAITSNILEKELNIVLSKPTKIAEPTNGLN